MQPWHHKGYQIVQEILTHLYWKGIVIALEVSYDKSPVYSPKDPQLLNFGENKWWCFWEALIKSNGSQSCMPRTTIWTTISEQALLSLTSQKFSYNTQSRPASCSRLALFDLVCWDSTAPLSFLKKPTTELVLNFRMFNVGLMEME